MGEPLRPRGGSIAFRLNERTFEVSTIEQLGQALDEIDAVASFDLSVTWPDGPVVRMLRNGPAAWLMYSRHEGAPGFHSLGDATRPGAGRFPLRNCRVDEYPLAWCLDVENCYKAIAHVCANGGAKPGWVDGVDGVED